jgi:glycosyltransferase involved in cell wall biosynthesis
MIGVVIPVHNEEAYLHACLIAVQAAISHPALLNEEVRVVVVLDDCSDRSGQIAQALAVDFLAIEARNVGLARAAGAAHLLEAGARWLAFTDADSVVSYGWLTTQLSLNADAVCGTVAVEDWAIHGEDGALLKGRFHASYNDHDQHRHIHGANFGVSAAAYRQAGGFSALACGEDVALVNTLIACGARVSWSAAPRVTTTSRFSCRARGGFGDTLKKLLAVNEDY